MNPEKHYRHELKYIIPYAEYLAMRSRIRQVCDPDKHTEENGSYRIRSIYFDNINDKALREKIDGISKREKFRIRYYNDNFSPIFLEKKVKDNSLTLKHYTRSLFRIGIRRNFGGGNPGHRRY